MLSATQEYSILKRMLKNKVGVRLGVVSKELLKIDSNHTTRLLSHQLNMVEIRKCNQILRSLNGGITRIV